MDPIVELMGYLIENAQSFEYDSVHEEIKIARGDLDIDHVVWNAGSFWVNNTQRPQMNFASSSHTIDYLMKGD